MNPMVVLTDEQIKQYNKNGFLLVKNLIPLSIIDEINDLCKKFNHVTKDDWEIGKEMANVLQKEGVAKDEFL